MYVENVGLGEGGRKLAGSWKRAVGSWSSGEEERDEGMLMRSPKGYSVRSTARFYVLSLKIRTFKSRAGAKSGY